MYDKTQMMIETKADNGKWIGSNKHYGEAFVHERLMHDLIAKKLNKCSYITSIKRTNLYNGFQEIVVTYNNRCRIIYIVKCH